MTIISCSVEISITGGGEEMVGAHHLVTFSFLFLYYVFVV